MSIITISRGSYSHGRMVAEELAQKLNYSCISRSFLIGISKEFNIPEIKLLRAISASPTALEPYTFARDKYIAYIRSAILDHLAKDNTVYHGFAGHFFVEGIRHCLKVRILASMDERIKCMMAREKVSSRKKAQKMVEQVDEERRRWSLKLYGMDTWDSRLYDLAIRIDKMTVSDAVRVIQETLVLKAFQTTPESFAKMEQLAREARKQLEEFSSRTSFFEPMRQAPWQKGLNENDRQEEYPNRSL